MNTGIFDHELGRSVQRDFKRLMADGLSSYAAASQILAEQGARIHDPDDGPAIYFALSDLQLDQGTISPAIRKRALTLINSGEALERWRGQPPGEIAARCAVEQALRERLVAAG